MKHTEENIAREQVSALADGRLTGEAFDQTVDHIGSDADLQASWRAYHLVGDLLRAGAHAPCSDGSVFLARFQQRLAAEPPLPAVVVPVVAAIAPRRIEAANEPVFRWKLVAGAASLAAAAAIGWNWVGSGTDAVSAGPSLAQQQPAEAANSVLTAVTTPATSSRLAPTRVVLGNGEAQVMLRDPRLDQLLEAHRQAGGASQMPSGFLRNATFEGASR